MLNKTSKKMPEIQLFDNQVVKLFLPSRSVRFCYLSVRTVQGESEGQSELGEKEKKAARENGNGNRPFQVKISDKLTSPTTKTLPQTTIRSFLPAWSYAAANAMRTVG